jgi:hypothetical protein
LTPIYVAVYPERALGRFWIDSRFFGQYRRILALNINKINFRSIMTALAFGVVVTGIPALAGTVSFTTSGNPVAFGVGM